MSITSGFFDSVNHDRKYNAKQFSTLFDGIINDGVFMSVGECFAVTPSGGMTIKIGEGRAWFNHTWTYNDGYYRITLDDANTAYPRIDAVVLEVNTGDAVRKNSIRIIKGQASTDPKCPELSMNAEAGFYQYMLAYVTIPARASKIDASNITNLVGKTVPFVSGPLETISASAVYDGWRLEFDEWFSSVQSVLDEDAAGELLNRIDEISKRIDNLNSIGDVKVTLSDNISSDWVQLDGRYVKAEEYPDAGLALPEGLDFSDVETQDLPNPNLASSSIYHVNGIDILFNRVANQLRLYAKGENDSEWTENVINLDMMESDDHPNAGYGDVANVLYVNNTYVIILANDGIGQLDIIDAVDIFNGPFTQTIVDLDDPTVMDYDDDHRSPINSRDCVAIGSELYFAYSDYRHTGFEDLDLDGLYPKNSIWAYNVSRREIRKVSDYQPTFEIPISEDDELYDQDGYETKVRQLYSIAKIGTNAYMLAGCAIRYTRPGAGIRYGWVLLKLHLTDFRTGKFNSAEQIAVSLPLDSLSTLTNDSKVSMKACRRAIAVTEFGKRIAFYDVDNGLSCYVETSVYDQDKSYWQTDRIFVCYGTCIISFRNADEPIVDSNQSKTRLSYGGHSALEMAEGGLNRIPVKYKVPAFSIDEDQTLVKAYIKLK